MTRIRPIPLLMLFVSLALAGPAAAVAQAQELAGTWWVLIHYQREKPDGSVTTRWYWDDRVWIIEREGEGYAWTEYALVNFDDKTGRFEHLGTPRGLRLTGAWTPNSRQKRQLDSGIEVNPRGSRRKLLEGNPAEGWKSALDSSRRRGAAGYTEAWEIKLTEALPEFIQSAQIQHWRSTEALGVTRYRVENVRARGRELSGSYSRAEGNRLGKFRMVRTRIREEAIEQETPGGIDLRLIPGRPSPGEQSWADLFLEIARPRFYFDERITSIDSTPPGAELELFYLRRGGQLLYREGRAPLVVSIPSRNKTSEDDAILISASLDGREKTRTSFPALSVPDEIHLELPPLENQLLSVAHGHLAGRSVLELRTVEPPTLTINENPHAYTVQIARTGVSAEVTRHLASLTDPLLARVRAHQLGEDLVLRLSLARKQGEIRVRQFELADAVSGVHRTRIELMDLAVEHDRTSRLLRTLESLDAEDLPRCTAAFEAEIRRHLDSADLASALSHHQNPEVRVLRAALRRYAEAGDPSPLTTLRGDQLMATEPLEFELAATQASEIRGYLAWLRLLSERLDPSDSGMLGFRSLIAPELSPDAFASAYGQAQEAERRCALRASRDGGG